MEFDAFALSHGQVTLEADGSFSYAPVQGFVGEDSFTYLVSANGLNSNQATVQITLHQGNSPPTAVDDTYEVSHDKGISVSVGDGVIANDSDPDNDSLFATAATQPQHGTLTMNFDGSFTYQPVPGYIGPDSFTYTVSDGTASDVGSVDLNVINHPPKSEDLEFELPASESGQPSSYLDVPMTTLLGKATDADGDPLAVLFTNPALAPNQPVQLQFGTVELRTVPGYEPVLRYTAGFDVGTDHIKIRIDDGIETSEEVDVMFDVRDADDSQIYFTNWAHDRLYDDLVHKDALSISDDVTTERLNTFEVSKRSGYLDRSADPENYRIQLYGHMEGWRQMLSIVQVYRGGVEISSTPVMLYRYYTDAHAIRGYHSLWLRFVSTDTDDNASGYGESSDRHSQTIKVQLGDRVHVYVGDGSPNHPFRESEIQVGRPVGEANNTGNAPWDENIREVKMRIVVFRNAADTAPEATRAQVMKDIDFANAYLAQAGIRVNVLGIDMGGAGDPGRPRVGTDPAHTFVTRAYNPLVDSYVLEELKDADPDSIDVYYTGISSMGAGTLALSYVRHSPFPSHTFNAIAMMSTIDQRPLRSRTLPHESEHILLDSGHKAGDQITNLFVDGRAIPINADTNAVRGARRIGPYNEGARDDVSVLRRRAADLPK